MKRRALLLATGAWAALVTARAGAQSSNKRRLIGWLSAGAPDYILFDFFRTRLKELGYVEGRDIAIEFRWAEGKSERLPALARELLALKPAVIVCATTPVAAALKKETSTTPVVFIAVGVPDEQGFVQTLARPGGNMTGLAFQVGVVAKVAQVIRETMPAARRIAMLWPDGDPALEKFRPVFLAQFVQAGFAVEIVQLKQPGDFARGFAEIARRKVDVVYAPPFSLFVTNSRPLVELAIWAKLPLIGPRRSFPEAGALLSYADDLKDQFRRAAVFVDKILKGANPADLPVEQPDRFELVINMRTAKALGIRIPRTVLLQATEVIQ